MEIDARELMGKELKPLVVKNYVDFCKAVEEIVNFSISSDVIFLFNKINEVRKTYTTLKETAEKYGLFFLKRAN
jgi:large-conductance mechanosensitive channel